jgi:hypothetical protein
MEIKLEQLVAVSDRIDAAGKTYQGSLTKLLTKELPVKTAYTVGKLANKVMSELRQYYQHRDNLIKKYGKEKDGSYTIESTDKDAIEKFSKDNEELLSYIVKFDYEPVALEALGDIKLAPIDMGNLEMFFKQLQD